MVGTWSVVRCPLSVAFAANGGRSRAIFVAALLAICPTLVAETILVDSVVLGLLDEAQAPAMSAGVVTELGVREGSRVKRGEVLAQLDDAQQQLAERAAAAELAIAEEKANNDVRERYAAKARDAAAAELRRSEESIRKFPKSVSQSQIDVERLTFEKAALDVEIAKQNQRLAKLETKLKTAEHDAAELNRKRRAITAPIDGVVVELATRLGEWLEPGQAAMRIVNTSRLKAEGFAAADQPLTSGKAVTLVVDDGDTQQRYPGAIVFISPEVDPINNQIRVWAEIANPDGALRPGMKGRLVVRGQGSVISD